MITYLKSPRLSKFSTESIIKQEEALAELDLSIDEWVTKLEQAENRRARVSQKLLEHIAAALAVPSDHNGSILLPTTYSEEQTPPRSPEKVLSPQTPNRRAVESIKIYADSDMYDLLADIEREMDMMVDSKGATMSP